jgi:DNA invertase Pin-like site-specific DNA recombinase
MASGKYVSYFRVSTQKQGNSGLGLEAQQAMVRNYLNGGNWKVVAEFVEVESGKKTQNRPKLNEALALCRKTGATLLIAKLDRLARDVHFISGLIKSGVKFIAVESPNDDTFMLHMRAVIGEKEANDISARTKAALQAAKARGTVLGGRRVSAERWAEITSASNQQRSQAASVRSAAILPVIQSLRSKGATTLRQIASGLNEGGFLTAKGKQWTAVQVMRVLKDTEAIFA